MGVRFLSLFRGSEKEEESVASSPFEGDTCVPVCASYQWVTSLLASVAILHVCVLRPEAQASITVYRWSEGTAHTTLWNRNHSLQNSGRTKLVLPFSNPAANRHPLQSLVWKKLGTGSTVNGRTWKRGVSFDVPPNRRPGATPGAQLEESTTSSRTNRTLQQPFSFFLSFLNLWKFGFTNSDCKSITDGGIVYIGKRKSRICEAMNDFLIEDFIIVILRRKKGKEIRCLSDFCSICLLTNLSFAVNNLWGLYFNDMRLKLRDLWNRYYEQSLVHLRLDQNFSVIDMVKRIFLYDIYTKARELGLNLSNF